MDTIKFDFAKIPLLKGESNLDEWNSIVVTILGCADLEEFIGEQGVPEPQQASLGQPQKSYGRAQSREERMVE
jgi:hypothetical protein